MSKKITFLRVLENIWLAVSIVSIGLFLYKLFSEEKMTSDQWFLLGVSIVAFIMFLFRRRNRKMLEELYRKEQQK